MRMRCGVTFGGLLLAALAFGCGNSEPTTPAAPMPAMGGGPPTGNKVFDTHCLNCHSTQAGGAPGKAPNLSKVGAIRAPEWLAEHVKDPKSHKPDSMMPGFGGGKLNAEELKSVTDFMAGLK